MTKKKKKPADELIESMMVELQSSSTSDSAQPAEKSDSASGAKDSTAIIDPPALFQLEASQSHANSDRTMVVGAKRSGKEPETKTSFGIGKQSQRSAGANITDAQLMQAESLRLAQQRITELEKEVEKLREENEFLSSAGDIAREKADEMQAQIERFERERSEQAAQAQAEVNIYKESLNEKDRDLIKLRKKVEELEARLSMDLRKIRVRERELENRLELTKLEKMALVRAKDDSILELKAKIDLLNGELEDYKNRCSELNRRIESNHEQLGRTVRALRLALTNLEVNENTDVTVAPLKKAE